MSQAFVTKEEQIQFRCDSQQNMPGTVIYKTTKTGATQQWSQEIGDGGRYRTISGQVGGKLITSDWTQCEATNVGRANERNLAEQAIFEVNANYKKKLEKDYHFTVDTIDEGSHIIEAMLAHEYGKSLDRKNPPVLSKCYSQPKLDGMRCLINKDGMWTRNGKAIVSCPHIFRALKYQFELFPDMIFDGELYNHDFKANFNEIMSIFKQLKPTEEDLAKAAKFGQYHVYDIASSGAIFSTRTEQLKNIVKSIDSDYIQYVRTDKIRDNFHLDSLYFDTYLEQGYEGQMIREDKVYEGKRTWSLLKRKEFFDGEYELVDLEPGVGNWAGKAKRAILKTKDARLFGAGITGTMEFCEEVLKNKVKYIGKKTNVNYTNLTPDGIPRFGRVKELDRMDV